MLDQTSRLLIANPEPPLGWRFFTAFVWELDEGNNPVHTFLVHSTAGSTTTIVSRSGEGVDHDPADANLFPIPTGTA